MTDDWERWRICAFAEGVGIGVCGCDDFVLDADELEDDDARLLGEEEEDEGTGRDSRKTQFLITCQFSNI